MDIDSARELKTVALKQAVQPLVASVRGLSSLALAARPVSEVDRTQRTLAVGIARKGKGNYQLAVRIQSRALENSEQIENIRKRAKGEVDVRYVGRGVKRAGWNQSRQRPLLIGTSIGHFRITAGTLGCLSRLAAQASGASFPTIMC